MSAVLHILSRDSAPLAPSVIEITCREPDTRVTVVLLGGAAVPAVPSSVAVRRLAAGDLDYAGLLDLIFDADRVISW